MVILWVVALCRLARVYQRIRGLYCLHHQGDEAVQTSETLVKSYQSTWRCNPEDGHFHSHHRGNLKSYAEKLLPGG
jgi:hypothetical protein